MPVLFEKIFWDNLSLESDVEENRLALFSLMRSQAGAKDEGERFSEPERHAIWNKVYFACSENTQLTMMALLKVTGYPWVYKIATSDDDEHINGQTWILILMRVALKMPGFINVSTGGMEIETYVKWVREALSVRVYDQWTDAIQDLFEQATRVAVRSPGVERDM
jgi:hypothetical protein